MSCGHLVDFRFWAGDVFLDLKLVFILLCSLCSVFVLVGLVFARVVCLESVVM